MHVMIINGSPRARKYSNTEKIIASFGKGLSEKGVTFETHAISECGSWDEIRDAYERNTEILIALPLFVECVPGLLLEFLETLPQKDERTRMSFLLQSGFAEGDGFLREKAKAFTGPEYFSLPMRLMMSLVFKTVAKKMFQRAAVSWGCHTPLDEKVWES